MQGLCHATMLIPKLRTHLELIKALTPFDTFAKIDAAMGFSGNAARGWCRESGATPAGYVPDDAVPKLLDFVGSLLSPRPSNEALLHLLLSDPIYLHLALRPIGSRAWSRLLTDRLSATPMAVTFAPPPSFGFGEIEDLPEASDWHVPPGWRFRFQIQAPGGAGELFLLTDHNGLWQAKKLSDAGLICRYAQQAAWPAPADHPDGRARHYAPTEREAICRFVGVAVSGSFGQTVRDALSPGQALDQSTLDLLGEALLATPDKAMSLNAVTIRFSEHGAAPLPEDAA